MDQSFVFNDNFWVFLSELEKVEGEVELKTFLNRPELSDLDPEEAKQYLTILERLSYPFSLKSLEDGPLWIITSKKNECVSINLSFSEWLAFQAHFPLMGQYSNKKFHELLSDKLASVESQYSQYDLFNYLNEKRVTGESKSMIQKNSMVEQVQSNLKKLQALIDSKKIGLVKYLDKSMEVYFHYLVYIDGELQAIGEEKQDRCLIALKVSEVSDVLAQDENYVCNFSMIEVQDFISAVRAIGEKEVRLVLKIISPEAVDLNPPYHFLGRPYITSNLNGKLIWGATIELSEEVLSWLYEIRNEVEILDPPEIKLRFEEYCKQKEASEGRHKAIEDEFSSVNGKGLKKAS